MIDLSPAARQPLGSEDGSVQVTCNGEIYNHRELRQQLVDAGHQFRSGSDNEVLVHGYEQWGMEGVLKRIKGMFAFAVWDVNSRTLWLARDRLGVKPLFYTEHEHTMLFSSEVNTLYRRVGVSSEMVDRVAVDYFLSSGHVPPDRSMVSGIEKLPPGHVLRYDEGGTTRWRYWDVDFGNIKRLPFQEHLERTDQLLNQAVVRRLEADVPIGSFLSAGIDSSLVTAIAASHAGKPFRTFTVGFDGDDPENDERVLARLVAERYGTKHEELHVSPTDKSCLPALMWNCGEPLYDLGIVPFYSMARMAREDITVALTGDGGDESFGGYYNVYAAYLGSKVRRFLPGHLRGAVHSLLPELDRHSALPRPIRRIETLFRYASQRPIELYDFPDWWHSRIRPDLYDPAWRNGSIGDDPLDVVGLTLQRASNLDEVEQILYTDFHHRLPGDYLTKADVASNAVALELRSPFLDHDLVEYAATIPTSTKMYKWRQKGLLREVARQYLPEPYIRRRKTGLGPPIRDWLLGDWAPIIREFVEGGIAQRAGLFDRQMILKIAEEHRDRRANHSSRLWALVCMEIWWRMFIDGSMGPNDEI